MSNVFTSAGTTFGISATLPTTFDDNVSTGYPSLTFTNVAEITNYGEFGAVYELVTHIAMDRRDTVKRKGTYDNGELTLELGLDTTDAGQQLVETARDDDASYAIEIVLQDGTSLYFTAQVMSYTYNVAGPNDITGSSVSVQIDRDIVRVAAP